VAERPGSRLDGIDAFSTFLALSERENGCAALRLVKLLPGEDPFGNDLLERSTLVEGGAFPNTVAISSNPNFETSQVRVLLTSLTTPRLIADVVVETGEIIVRKQQVVLGGYEESDLVTVDDDGTLNPVAPSPFLLYGYGSYEISIDPVFSSLRLSLLDRGVIFAIAHVRGGGEMGRSWYEMGRLAQKPTTFSDFVAVARALVAQGWTTPDQLAARGGSAGGLLMGAVMNQAPELFHAIVAEVPFVDVVTTMLDDSLPLTAGEWEEWGNPEASATSYRTMLSYSPYDNVRTTHEDGTPVTYPHLYASGGLNDSRVGFWEPAKWVLKLRDANESNVAVLKTEMGAGHGGPSGRYDAWRDEAQVLAWLLNEITTVSSNPSP
jgi:oligopeptidase B